MGKDSPRIDVRGSSLSRFDRSVDGKCRRNAGNETAILQMNARTVVSVLANIFANKKRRGYERETEL